MSQMNQQQLSQMDLKGVQDYKETLVKRQKQLETLKAGDPKKWTEALQDELNEIVLTLVDIDEALEEKLKTSATKAKNYTLAKGTEKLVHLRISKSRRFDPQTGKEITKPYVQLFTYGEWKLFEQNCKSLGFVIVEELHNPYKK